MGPLVDIMGKRFSFFDSYSELDKAFQGFGQDFVQAFRGFRTRVLSAAGLIDNSRAKPVNPGLISALAAGVNVERLSNHPVNLNNDDIISLYQNILKDISGVVNTEGNRL